MEDRMMLTKVEAGRGLSQVFLILSRPSLGLFEAVGLGGLCQYLALVASEQEGFPRFAMWKGEKKETAR